MASGKEKTITSDIISHLEDLVLIWLDATIDSNDVIWSKRQNILRNCINSIRTFTDQSECLKYISTIRDERIFMIASGSIGEIIVPQIHDLSQISEIYIFCGDIIKHKQWSKSFPKIRDVFNDENSLMICLDKDVKIYSKTLIPINIDNPNQRSLQDIDEEQVAFIWFQLMVEVLCRLQQTSISKKEMIDECRAQYAGNSVQLRMIDEFYNKYNGNLAIDWYTKDCFLYRLLNKAFRTENIDIIFNYHYFLSDLTNELTKLYGNQYGNKTGTLIVYRGQHMRINELQKIQNSIGRLMSINTFFSTTTSSSVAADFSGNGEYRSQGIESVIFQIEIDLSIQRRPFAKIDQLSNNRDENEILFAMGSVFRIKSVEPILDNIWLIILTLTNEVKKEVEDLLEYFIKHIGTQPSLLELGVLLSKTGDFERAKRFYLRLKNELPEDHYDLGVLYNNLGEIYRQQGYFDIAMNHYVLAIDQLINTFDFFHPWFAIVHSNIAMIFDAHHQFDEALVSYQCALSIMEYCEDDDEEELFSTIYHGMANIYQQKGQLKTALEFYEKTLKIESNILPSNHPSIAITFNNIGKLYFEMKDYSKALENFLKAFPIMLSTLPNNHPQLAVLYGSIGSAYNGQNEISKSIEYLLKAEQIVDRSTLTSDHNFREVIYRTLAIISRGNKMNDLSIRIHQKLINVYKAQTPSNQYEIADWTSSLGDLFFNQGDHEQSFKCHQLALNIIQQLPRTEKNKHLYSNIINSFQLTKYTDIAIEHYKRLLSEETNTQSIFAGKLHNNLGAAYDQIDNDLAIKHYREALSCYSNKSGTFSREIAIIHYNIATILNDMDDYDDALSNVYKALDILDKTKHHFHSLCHNILGKIYEKTNDLNRAQKHFDHAIELAMREKYPNHTMINEYTFYLQRVMKKKENNTLTNLEPVAYAGGEPRGPGPLLRILLMSLMLQLTAELLQVL